MIADQIDIDRQKDLSRLWKVHKTIHKMAKDRCYIVAEEEYQLPLDAFVSRFGQNLSRDGLAFLFQKDTSAAAAVAANGSADGPTQATDDGQLIVFFTEDTNVGVKPIRQFVQTMSDKNIMRAIVVIRQSITPAAQKIMQSLPKLKFEMFYEAELLVNITEHQLVPKHELLTADERKELLKRYHLRETQLPRIYQQDPVAKYFGLKRGDVVRILRASETAGRYVTYRLVI